MRFDGRHKAFVLGLGVNGLSVVRSLGRRGIPVVGLTSSRSDVGRHSRYCRAILLPQLKHAQEEWLKALIRLGQELDAPGVLFPTGDETVLFVARHRAELDRHFKIVSPLPETVESLVNKERLYEAAQAQQMPLPKTLLSGQLAQLCAAGSLDGQMTFPCALKPVYSHLWRRQFHEKKLMVVHSWDELLKRYQELSRLGLEVVVQELIPGRDDQFYSYQAYLDEASQPRAVFVKRKLRQYPNRFGVTSLGVGAWEPEVAALGERLLKGLGYRGIASVEFKRDERDGRLKFIEVNARTILSQGCAMASGVDLVYCAYRDAIGRPLAPVSSFREGRKWVHLGIDILSFREAHRAGKLTWTQWLASLWGVRADAVWAWDDPVPGLQQAARLVGAISRKGRAS